MSVIVLHSEKGGTGKSTIAANLSAYLTQKGHKPIIIDADSQSNLTMYALGKSVPVSLLDVFQGASTIQAAIQSSPFGDILTSAANLAALNTVQPSQLVAPFKTLIDRLSEQYSDIIIDAPPQWSTMPVLAYNVADYLIIPIQASLFCLQGLSNMAAHIGKARATNSKLKIAGIVINRYDHRRAIDKQIAGAVEGAAAQMGTKVFESKLRSYTVYETALINSESVLNMGGKASENMRELCEEINKTING